MDQVDSVTIYLLDCVDTIDTVLTHRHCNTAPLGWRFKTFRGHFFPQNILRTMVWIQIIHKTLMLTIYNLADSEIKTKANLPALANFI